MTVDEFTRLEWRVIRDAPVIGPPLGSPLIADPTFLLPHETPDGRWHLFAHSIFGVHAFTSDDGTRWSRGRLVVPHAMRAYVRRDGDLFHLFYERYPAFRLPLAIVPGLRWRSWIESRSSADLRHWSRPRIALRPSLGWHRVQGLGAAVGNPTVLPTEHGWTLWYSAALVRVPDCGFNEPLHIGIAHAETIAGPYRSEPSPVLSPSTSDPRANLGAGAMRVVALADGFVGLQNGIAWDEATRTSRSAISVRRSTDGRQWDYATTRRSSRRRPAGARASSTRATPAKRRAAAGISTSTPATRPRCWRDAKRSGAWSRTRRDAQRAIARWPRSAHAAHSGVKVAATRRS